MDKFKLIICLFLMTIISCNEKNIENHYENDKIKITYKENNAVFSENYISLQFESKDTIIESKNYTFKDINDLFLKSLGKTKKEINYLETGKYDVLIIKKDTVLNTDKIYQEFERFLITNRLIKTD